MIQITKEERDYLYNKGFQFGEDLHRTVKNRSYYATERIDVITCLLEYRRNKRLINKEKKS